MKMNNILMVGFSPDINIKIGGYSTIHHTPFQKEEGGLSPKEYELLCKKIVKQTSIVILNLDKKHLTFDESFLIIYAYTKNTPIVGVGEKIRDNLLDVVLTNKFDFLQDAIKHIKNNY